MLTNKIFYNLKPFIPRTIQIALRRQVVLYKRKKCSHIWPIDPDAGKAPDKWLGWPDKKRFALVLAHDVDTQRGHDKCRQLMDLEESLGFKSSFNFVAERYIVSQSLRDEIISRGFEIGVHGLKHDGKLFKSKKIFNKRVERINYYLKEWGADGFTSPSMHHNLDWMHALNIKYDISTFDTDPFEPQPDAVGTIFPFWVRNNSSENGFIELPYTLPQDFSLFVIMMEKNINIWKKKLDWIAAKGGMALVNTHPDYMRFDEEDCSTETYPFNYYKEFLLYVRDKYNGQYWHTLPEDIASFYKNTIVRNSSKLIAHSSKSIVHSQAQRKVPPSFQYSSKLIAQSSKENSVFLIDPVNDPRWDKFVENHPLGWICHTSGWKQVLEQSFKHMKGYYFAFIDEDNNIKAALPVFEVTSKILGNRLVSIPYATLCDPLVSNKQELIELVNHVRLLSKELRSAYVEIRTHFSYPFFHKINGFGSSDLLKHHYLTLDTDLDSIMKSFHRKTVRQSVRRSLRSNFTLKVANNESDLLNFYNLYIKTRKNIGLPPQPFIFFKTLWEVFLPSNNMVLLMAEKADKLVAGVIIFKFKNRVSADYGAWDRKYSKLCPNHYLYWQVIKLAHSEGYKIFDLGRTSVNNKRLMDFKRHWGTKVVDLPSYYYPEMAADHVAQKESSITYQLLNKICNNAPDAACRLIGNFCYRHLG